MNLLMKLALVALVIWGVMTWRDPYRTRLPLDVSNLSTLQPQLDRLPEADKAHVLAYLGRSRGDVMPAAFADPDEPFTARTFAEAIELQKKFEVVQAKRDAAALARKAERDKALAPLRAALRVELLRREILSRSELQQPAAMPTAWGAKEVVMPVDTSQVLVETFRLTNTADDDITALKVSIDIRKAKPAPTELGLLSGCYIERNEPMLRGESVEVRCANLNKLASDQDRAFVNMAESEFTMEAEPRLIRFGSGNELTFRQ